MSKAEAVATTKECIKVFYGMEKEKEVWNFVFDEGQKMVDKWSNHFRGFREAASMVGTIFYIGYYISKEGLGKYHGEEFDAEEKIKQMIPMTTKITGLSEDAIMGEATDFFFTINSKFEDIRMTCLGFLLLVSFINWMILEEKGGK